MVLLFIAVLGSLVAFVISTLVIFVWVSKVYTFKLQRKILRNSNSKNTEKLLVLYLQVNKLTALITSIIFTIYTNTPGKQGIGQTMLSCYTRGIKKYIYCVLTVFFFFRICGQCVKVRREFILIMSEWPYLPIFLTANNKNKFEVVL